MKERKFVKQNKEHYLQRTRELQLLFPSWTHELLAQRLGVTKSTLAWLVRVNRENERTWNQNQ
jgi:hypothetical protein